MTNQKLEELKKKIVEAVPEIKALNPGVKVKFHILEDSFGDIIPINPGDSDYLWIREEGKPECFTISKSTIVEILGRDITLEDVLRALDKPEANHAINCEGQFLNQETEIPLTYAFGTGVYWRFGKSLSEQSDLTINFLHSILCK